MEQPTDIQLLQAFRDGDDPTAFATLMQRHGGMVLSAARTVLHDTAGAEDVVQATFLTLARKAGSLSGESSLASWLYFVAVCLARDERRKERRRKVREEEAAVRRSMQGSETMLSDADRAALHVEIANLSSRDRAPVLLFHLEGKSYENAAAELGVNAKTFSMRLTRAREKLRRRLQRRGVVLAAASLVSVLTKTSAAAEISPALLASTCQAAACVVSGQAVAGGLVSAQAGALMEGALKMLFWMKVKTVTAICAGVVLVAGSVPAGLATAAAAKGDPPAPVAAPVDLPGPMQAARPAPAPEDVPELPFKIHDGDPVDCARAYRKAMTIMEALPDGWEDRARAYTDGRKRPAKVDIDMWLPTYRQALIAAQHKNVAWQRENRGMNTALPEMGPMRNLAYLTLAVGRYQLEQGEANGLCAWLAAWTMARHAAQDGPLICYLMQRAMHAALMESMQHTALAIPPARLRDFARQFASLPDYVPLAEALEGEKRFLQGQSAEGEQMTQERHDAMIRSMSAMYDKLIAAARLPVGQRREKVDALTAEARKHPDPMAREFFPDLNRFFLQACTHSAIRPLIVAVANAAAMDEPQTSSVVNPLGGKPMHLRKTLAGAVGMVPGPYPEVVGLSLSMHFGGRDREAIEESLKTRVTLEWKQARLRDALRYLTPIIGCERHVVLDVRSHSGVDANPRFTLKVENVPAGDVLAMIAKAAGGRYRVDEERRELVVSFEPKGPPPDDDAEEVF